MYSSRGPLPIELQASAIGAEAFAKFMRDRGGLEDLASWRIHVAEGEYQVAELLHMVAREYLLYMVQSLDEWALREMTEKAIARHIPAGFGMENGLRARLAAWQPGHQAN